MLRGAVSGRRELARHGPCGSVTTALVGKAPVIGQAKRDKTERAGLAFALKHKTRFPGDWYRMRALYGRTVQSAWQPAAIEG